MNWKIIIPILIIVVAIIVLNMFLYWPSSESTQKSKESETTQMDILNQNLLEHCIEVIPNHNNLGEKRINIVFVVGGVRSLNQISFDFKELFRRVIKGYKTVDPVWDAEGLKGIEPFASNFDKFNFWYIDIPLFGEGDPCEDIILPKEMSCESGMLVENGFSTPLSNAGTIYGYSKIKDYCNFENRYIHVFYKSNNYIPSMHLGGVGLSQSDLPDFALSLTSHYFPVFIHEFTHSFAGVGDEVSGSSDKYIQNEKISGPNCFSLGNVRLDSMSCARNENLPWKDLIGNGCGEDGVVDCQPDINKATFDKFDEWIYEVRDDIEGCGQGCSYIKNNIFRPFMACNVMSSCDLINKFGTFILIGKISKLGVINEREACRKIKGITNDVSDYCNKLCLSGCPMGMRCIQGNCIPQ